VAERARFSTPAARVHCCRDADPAGPQHPALDAALGNRLAIFVASGKAFRRYVRERRNEGAVLHIVLETRRLSTLRAELADVASFDVLSTPAQSDKICLVRAVLY
jgi:hypothetical protein